jgi:UDP-GlcNAc:undecaprenyl-phosphate GlcNAc-1-phosphate transferase
LNDYLLIAKLIVAFAAAFILIKLLIRYAPGLGLVDIPNYRSAHKQTTPRGAGIGIVFGVIVSDIFFLNNIVFSHIAAFVAIFLVFIVGVLDDHRDTTPKTKFYVIFIAVMLLVYDGMAVQSLGHLFGYQLSLGWFAIPFTVFAVAGFTNALNLSDGLDGLAGSLSIIILSTLCVIGYENDDLFIVSTSLSFIAAIMAFMWFNWNPARIFMGDSGSLTLGFVISVLSIKALAYINPISILFIAAIPILDTLIVMIRRKRTGHSMFAPDKLHIHHILLRFFNGNVRKTVILIALLQLGFSIVGMAFSDLAMQRYILILFLVNLAAFYLLLNGMLERQNKFSFYRKRRKKR